MPWYDWRGYEVYHSPGVVPHLHTLDAELLYQLNHAMELNEWKMNTKGIIMRRLFGIWATKGMVVGGIRRTPGNHGEAAWPS
jgi:hypothetical protein